MSENSSDLGAFLAGFVIGGLVGALVCEEEWNEKSFMLTSEHSLQLWELNNPMW